MASSLKRILLGKPLASADEQHQRLSKKVALPVFSSDAISSTAYATEEILRVFLVSSAGAAAGVAAYTKLVPISLMVVFLLAVVVISYRQTIFAYPSGGGSYVVSRENLGEVPSLVAGSSLLTDYILTVAVSVAGGVAAIISAFPSLEKYRVLLCVGFILLMTIANLRGLKESGAVFAPPTYIYILSLLTLILVGLYRVFVQHVGPIQHTGEAAKLLDNSEPIMLFIFLKAFASGAVALSGVEAVSNGVPAFKKPESKNASTTLIWMGLILGSTFFGLSVIAQHFQPVPDQPQTVLAQLAEHIYGGRNIFYFVTQFATFAILILAANTAYADYPRLSSIIAKDGFLPRQFGNRGSRLVFSNGIIFLAVMAIALVVAFGGKIGALIPLYAVGVFTGFTLSQIGMCVHHTKIKEPRWKLNFVINAIGALTTGLVAAIVVTTKFLSGAYISVIVIVLLTVAFKAISRHYKRVKLAVTVEPGFKTYRHQHLVVVLVGSVNKGVLLAVQYARSLAPDRLIAVSVVSDPEEEHHLREQWDAFSLPVELHTISSPYRDLTGPVLAYLDELDQQDADEMITVVIPEFVTNISSQWLHNQSALSLKAKLLYRPNTVVTSVPVIVK
ncbi:MAG: Amino acid permease [Acidimicrobiales bacterium]|nr:Amino acid permease [Acidimicrobiales bacterium]